MKEISLTQGKISFVDAEDFEKVSQYKWCAVKIGRTWYAVTNIKIGDSFKTLHMHRFILDCTMGELVDHENHNGLDNRRSNIRKCTRQQNNSNARLKSNSTCLFKGVYYHKAPRLLNHWVAQITHNYKTMHIGCFKSSEEAAKAYDQKAKELFGSFACLNFS